MALNPNVEGKKDKECTETGDLHSEGGECMKNSSSTATSATFNQNGDQAGYEDCVMPEQEAPDRRRSGLTDVRSSSNSPLPGPKPAEELPRRNFQIPRKIKERKGLYQFLPHDSREFEDLAKIVSSFYLDSSSRGSFSYCKARLIHNELLEKEFIEKRREMKQEGRTEQELAESYCFLYPDKSKLQWICEKGLSVGHSRITTLGNPAVGVYLSKFSDLLQINPFEVGTGGDLIVFKVMRGRLKHIFENMPKNAMEPTPKFDCHVSKNANRVTSLLSYRAFELTQQYFFEFAFDEIKARPRHACPYAVVTFQYKGKDAASAPMTAHRFNTSIPEGSRGKNCYTVWSGPLVNKGRELFQVCLRSSTRPYLPFKLPDRLEVSHGMQLDQAKRKIPSVLFSWETYSISREVTKCGMSCSLFEVVDGKGKPTSGSLAALVHKLERDRMVLVKPLFDKGFLFLLSSAQMVNPNERRGRFEKGLHALFVFQESRVVVKYSSRLYEPDPLFLEPKPVILSSLDPFVPALHYALLKLRHNPGKDLSSGVERQAHDYLTRRENSTVRPFILPEYKQNLDDRGNLHPAPRPKHNMDGLLRSYVLNPMAHILSLAKAKDMIDKIQNPLPPPAPAPVEYSPVSDWGGSDRGSDRPERPPERPERPPPERPPPERPPPERPPPERPPPERPPPERPPPERLPPERPPHERAPADSSRRRLGVSHSNGAQPQPQSQQSQNEYDKDKMKQLLKLIKLRKKTLVKEPGKDRGEGGEDGAWDAHSLKRKLEGEDGGTMSKHLRTDPLSNGEPSRGAQADDTLDEGGQNDNLTAVMESMGIYDTDLRARGGAHSSSVSETHRLLKVLLTTLNQVMSQGILAEQPDHGEPSTGSGRRETSIPDPDLRKREEPVASQTNYTEEDMDCSPFSPGSPTEQPHSSDNPPWSIPTQTDKAQPVPEPVADSQPEVKEPSVVEVKEVKKAAPPPRLAMVEEPPQRPSISLDTILNQEVHSLTSDIKSIMQSHHINYNSVLPPRLPPRNSWLPNSSFSDFVVPYVTSVPVQGHVKALCEKMGKLIPPPPAAKVPPTTTTISSLPLPPALASTPKTKVQPSQSKSTSSSHSSKSGTVKASTKNTSETASTEAGGEMYSPSHVTTGSPDSNSTQNPASTPGSAGGTGSNLLASSLISQLKPEVFSSLVEIFKDVTKNTVKFYIYSGEDGDSSTICKEIKEYLISLGNSECTPQSFLENSSSLDKLLIIIQNEDIAAHVHKIPALMSLKKLSSVSFAGVDSLDDVKNHTYNELFVSGGFIVSDEFVLNPDLITQDRLQRLLKFLEEQSSPEQPWQWKVHCKSQKKLKELGRLNTNAMGLLNLLTIYQKKHLVEFLPYHECDAQSRQAPDLDCLIKLQAHHTQQRHLIFLTERPFEMFLQYSRNGIVIASIDDIMSGFHSLIGSIDQNELPTPPSTVVNDECVEAEDMSLDSDDGEDPAIPEPSEQNQEAARNPPQPPPPEAEEFRPPLPEQQATPGGTPNLSDYAALKTAISQFKAANQVGPGSLDIGSMSPGGFAVNPHQSFLCPSASWASYTGSSGYSASPAYPASPCSSTQEQDYRPTATAATSTPAPPLPTPAPPLPTTPAPPLPANSVPPLPATPAPPLPTVPAPPPPTTPAPPPPITLVPLLPTTAGPLANLASLPLEVKPPPPPHLMMLGHMYGSDTGGSGAVGSFSTGGTNTLPSTASPLSSTLTYTETTGASTASTGLGFAHSDITQHSYMTGVTTSASRTSSHQGDSTLSGSVESIWGTMRSNTCETSSSQGGGMPGSVAHTGLTQGGEKDWTETPGNSTPGSQGGRTPVNCMDSLGAVVGVPTATTRGGSVVRPKLPTHPLGGGSYGCISGIPGQMDHGPMRGALGPGSLGGYRGRGFPPGGPWPRSGRGHERGEGTGGGPPSWGYPLGRGRGQEYFSDYTYSHKYSP